MKQTIPISTAVIFCFLTFFNLNLTYAKRIAPKEVPPVIWKGIKYTAPHWGFLCDLHHNGGCVEAQDAKTGKKLWRIEVYKIQYQPDLETDIQDVFITSLRIDHDKLSVTNESHEEYEVDLKTKIIRRTKP